MEKAKIKKKAEEEDNVEEEDKEEVRKTKMEIKTLKEK